LYKFVHDRGGRVLKTPSFEAKRNYWKLVPNKIRSDVEEKMAKYDKKIQLADLMRGNIFDISVPLSLDTPVFPGQARFSKKILSSIAQGDRANVSQLSMTSHTGTHVDSPSHFIEGGLTIDEVPFKSIIGPARVFDLDVPEKIDYAQLEPLDIQKGEIVLFKTRNSTLWKERDFRKDYVFLTKEAARYLAEKEVHAVGVDYIIPEALDDLERPVHHILLGNNIVLIEGLNLDSVPPGQYLLICLPLKIAGGDAAPARAILAEA
jgi:arylformamidase